MHVSPVAVYLAVQHAGWRLGRADQMSASLLVVGVCSFLFHASLNQWAQFSDDISMLFLAAALLQRLCRPPARQRDGASPTAGGVGVTAAIYASVAAMSATYVRSGNLLVHVSMFAAMLVLIGLRTAYLVHRRVPPEQQGRYVRRFGGVCACLGVAFLLWNIDLEWCLELRRLRSAVGLPWAWLLELHGWWHVLTALGAALHMDLVRDLCP